MFSLVVLSVVLAISAANPISFWAAGLGSSLSSSWTSPSAAIIASPFAPVGPAASIGAYNYRGPLSLAPGQPANILAADGRPLDTLSVNLDRAVHNTARALEGSGQRLQKRSLVAATNLAAANLAATNVAAANLAVNNLSAANLAVRNLAAANLAGAPVVVGPLATGTFAARSLPIGPLASTSLAATPLTLGRTWVGLAPIAPLGFGVGNRLGNLW
ncbi:jg25867 [Pararge aegeria aegeria]|uniref:Jg25867 protein n=1 Tax=Pararge aegeria aegeria TaxID=348720 RepID=A0A8S4RT77_9NEOP|nr:jg25867 [Pararge aegeria aegeria]